MDKISFQHSELSLEYHGLTGTIMVYQVSAVLNMFTRFTQLK